MAATLTQEKAYTATANLLFRDDSTSLIEQSAGAQIADPTRVAATNDALIAPRTVAGRAARIAGDGITAAQVRSCREHRLRHGERRRRDQRDDARPGHVGEDRQRVRRGLHRVPQGDRPEAAAGRDRARGGGHRVAAAQRARDAAGRASAGEPRPAAPRTVAADRQGEPRPARRAADRARPRPTSSATSCWACCSGRSWASASAPCATAWTRRCTPRRTSRASTGCPSSPASRRCAASAASRCRRRRTASSSRRSGPCARTCATST